MEDNKTKEETIVNFIKDNPETSKDILMEKFSVPKQYAVMILRKTKGKFNREIFEK